ncbi:Protein tyrosine phosphatase domain-containing protein 1 [Schistosoma japonicum]|nr:Protein tyrosine phosphatase domain-containing protein 1 [Schistosoma japonicum]
MYILENLDWDGKYHSSLKCRNENLKSLNSPASDVLRQGIPERNLCLLFCGGSKCKYCNPPSFFDDNKMHLKGITQNILATSRPSEELINRFNIIEQFKRMKICSIFNMQTPGEHSSCGYGLQTSGFSYDPIIYMCCKLLVRFIITGSTSVLTDSSDYVNRMVNNEDSGQSSRKLSATPVTQLEVCTNSLSDENTELTDITLEPDNTFKNQGVNDNHSIGARSVTKALLTTQYPEFVANETERWKKKFNNDPEAWDDFEKSSLNPMVLVKLIDDWLMHLKPLSELTEHLLIERVLNWLCQRQPKYSNFRSKLANEQIKLYHHTRFDDLIQLAFKIMKFLIDFVKSSCTLIENVDLLSKIQ